MSNEFESNENQPGQAPVDGAAEGDIRDHLDAPDGGASGQTMETKSDSKDATVVDVRENGVGGAHDDGNADTGSDALAEAQKKPVIQVGPGTLNDSIEQAELCLAATERYFERAGSIVFVARDPSSGEILAKDVSRSALVRELDCQAYWFTKTSAGKWVHAHPPDRVCSTLVEAHEHKHLRRLNGLAHQPFLRPDGTLCATSGYDPITGVLAGFDELDFELAAHPTPTQAKVALELLDSLLSEFPFAADTDRSAALSAMLTAAVRPSLSAAPMFHVRAHQAGTGKSYLCRVITAFATARMARPMPFPGGDVECAKVVLSALKDGPAVIEFDNLTTDLVAHDSLCSALTAEQYSSRNLGHSRMRTVSTRALFLSSGNNVGPVGDMSRRCITINLDAGIEMPATRTFKQPGLLEEVRRDRAQYVSAALTVVTAWVQAGRPHSACQPVGGFGEWSDWCRQPLLWMAKPDPAASVFAAMIDDPERETVGQLLATLQAQFGSAPVMVKEMVKRAYDVSKPNAHELLEVLQDITGDRHTPNVKKLGQWIKRHAGQVVGGLKLVKSPIVRNAVVWQVEAA
jgi:hypothetical protein